MKHSRTTRFLSLVLAVIMVIGLVPMSVFAEEVGTENTLTATVSFDVNGGTGEIAPQNVVIGEKALKPETDPTHYFYEFAYWTANLEENVEWDFETPITEDITLYAVWGAAKELPLYNSAASGDYFQVISADTYDLAPGAQEHEIILNNADGNDRKVVHVFEVDTKNEDLEVMPGYYAIDKLDPENLPLDGIADKKQFWKAEQLTKTVKYYEGMGYNVVGAMNTALAYDSDAPYGYMVWNGVVLGTPEVHKGAQTYLAIDKDGNCELRNMSTPLNGTEWTAIPANFGWVVKNGELVSKTVERTSSDASRSIIGIKADGTLVFCLVDGRNAPTSSGLSNYELGEMMLALGCVNAVNCDGGGSSTFISKRVGETSGTMRSIPSDGSERATINSVILVSTAGASGELDKVLFDTEYNYVAPGASMAVTVTGQDTKAYPMDVPADVTYQIKEEGMGSFVNGVFTAGSATGTATIQAVYNGEVVGEKVLNIVHPESFGFTAETTALPMDKTLELEVFAKYGVDDWAVCVDGAYALSLPEENLGSYLDGNVMYPPSDPAMEMKTVNVTVTYLPDPSKTDVIAVMFGEASKVIYDFEDGETAGFMGFEDAKQWSLENGVNNTLVGSDPMAGQMNSQSNSKVTVASVENGGQVRNGQYAMAWSVDYTDADFAGWTYNVLFNVGETIVLRDVANGMNATSLGMWVYIPEGAAGLAFQSQFYIKNADGSYSCKQDHFMFETVSGVRKNLNSCTEADIPESRWVYASIDISKYDYLCTPVATDAGNSRSPSFIRTYIKPMTPAVHTFYIDDITLDYSTAVEDRVLPTITGVSYATQDTAVDLTEGAVINGNKVTFSANVADNQALDSASGKILVDGVALTTNVSGKAMSAEATLTSGVHTITFEICDKLGNLARVTRTITISGDAAITLTGHNDSGAKPEYDSIYYVDLNAADLKTLNGLTATLKLQNANTWEPAGITAAPGFTYEYSVNAYSNELTITLTRDSDVTLGEGTTLVSIPVRLWSWDGFDYVENKPIDPETHYKGGYCPVVTVECEVVYGKAEYTTNAFGAFGGAISVETMINDIVNPWHYHDDELTVLNKEATCTESGYTGRTYCETCKSVIDWGTKVAATGHTYVLTDEVLSCKCGALFTGVWEEDGKTYVDGVALADGWFQNSYYRDGVMLTGVHKVPAPDASGEFYYDFGEDGVCKGGAKFTGVFLDTEANVYRYSLMGVIATGWQLIGEDWYYFDPATEAAVTGEQKMGAVTYTFEETGKLTSGVWAKTLYGTRYYYGPSLYLSGWKTIDGNQYFFEDYYRVEGGIQNVFTNNINANWYYFDENGVYDEEYVIADGFYTDRKGYGYCKDGVALTGLQLIDGSYYYFDRYGYAQTGYVNGYYFGEDYKGLNGVYEIEGVLRYFNHGKSEMAGLVEVDGAYYFAKDSKGTCVTGEYYVWAPNGIVEKGTYTFGEDGKLVNGIVEKDGTYYYYEMGKGKMAGLVEVDGAYYFAKDSKGTCVTGEYYVWAPNGIVEKGTYTFGEDGKLLDGIVERDGNYYYYEMGKSKMAGLVEVDGAYYFAKDSKGTCVTGECYVWETNGLLDKDTYIFGEDGKMLDGFVTKEDGLYYYETGKCGRVGLNYIDGYYYFVDYGGKLITNRTYYVWETNGLSIKMNYTFDELGRAVI